MPRWFTGYGDMKTALIIQARIGSTRLPRKVLKDLAGRPMLAQELERLKRCATVDEIVVATTTNDADDLIVDLARREGVRWFRGSENDVLARYVGAAREAKADVIVRVTADCPLIDPAVTDRVVRALTENASECDYASNVLQRTYPRGLDVEVFFLDTLLRIDRMATSQVAREHVTVVARSERPGLFLCRSVEDSQVNADLRWTVDTEADFQVISKIYEGLDLCAASRSYQDILAFVRAHPEISRLNEGIETWTPIAHSGYVRA